MPYDQTSPTGPFKLKLIDVEDQSVSAFQVPTFVNYTAAWRFGRDVYVDMGLVAIEELLSIKPDEEVTVIMYDRFAMSMPTFEDFVQKINTIHSQLKQEGSPNNGPAEVNG